MHKKSLNMDKISITGIWLNRVIILFVSVLFVIIGLRNILNLTENAGLIGIVLETAKAKSIARVSLGGLPLAFAIVVLSSIFSDSQLYRGILTIFILIGVVTIVRLIGYSIDGAAPFIAPEIVITILSGVGLFLEMRRRRKFVETHSAIK